MIKLIWGLSFHVFERTIIAGKNYPWKYVKQLIVKCVRGFGMECCVVPLCTLKVESYQANGTGG